MPYAASDLPDEWRSPPGTRGANARLGTFRQLTGHKMPDIFSFTYWLGSNTSGDFNAATHEVAGTGWSIAEYIKGIIWALRKLRSDYEGHKLQQADLESQNTAHAVSTLESFTQVRGTLDALRTELQDLRAGIETMGSESVHVSTLAALSQSIDEVRAEQNRLLCHIESQGYSARLDTIETAAEQESERSGNLHERLEKVEAADARWPAFAPLENRASVRLCGTCWEPLKTGARVAEPLPQLQRFDHWFGACRPADRSRTSFSAETSTQKERLAKQVL